ncbi:hypothetical protein PCANC_20384 [Puccinia coronata f. sp. avenae]|uniref:Uncharacterized protein n=1 Tax=Puccinia coronata f. sp. avenae TaxID=200324 RepID=A0A2N5UMH1_9BASI|nr:hypothetical protein PCANC_20384 [Puccinia coronata f. sp. avenae]PLW38958.1 hypothetical protein PCASD_11716 [Puccinia coronata f. sp. avenae]
MFTAQGIDDEVLTVSVGRMTGNQRAAFIANVVWMRSRGAWNGSGCSTQLKTTTLPGLDKAKPQMMMMELSTGPLAKRKVMQSKK